MGYMFAKKGEAWDAKQYAKDQREIAERAWNRPRLAPKPQQPMDIGLFSDDAAQLDLLDMSMFQQPVED